MTYDVVFDVADTGYRYWWLPMAFLALTGAFVGFGAASGRFRGSSKMWSWGRLSAAGAGIALTVVSFIGPYAQFARMRAALREGRYVSVEGPVSRFHPQAPGDHEAESFDVGGHHFEYSASVLLPGFNWTRSHGGPIREGLQVRIADVDGEIARLEVVNRPGIAGDSIP